MEGFPAIGGLGVSGSGHGANGSSIRIHAIGPPTSRFSQLLVMRALMIQPSSYGSALGSNSPSADKGLVSVHWYRCRSGSNVKRSAALNLCASR